MKKTYQISRRRAAEKFRKFALANPTPIQLTFPLTEIAELAQASLGDLLRGVGKMFIETVMETEVEHVAGKRSQPNPQRTAFRGGAKKDTASSTGSAYRSSGHDCEAARKRKSLWVATSCFSAPRYWTRRCGRKSCWD